MKKKLCIVGHARSGKDTMAEILREEFGYTFKSSSQAASDIFIYDRLKDKYGYTSPEQCFEDRVNRRKDWYEMICEYNKNDKARLAKEIMKSNDIYVGMRDREEIEECIRQGIFDTVVWVDASGRVQDEPATSFNITIDLADKVISNKAGYPEFREKVIKFANENLI